MTLKKSNSTHTHPTHRSYLASRPPACRACLPARRYREQPTLPFNAYGTMAIAREEFEANSGSSQFFWLLKVGMFGRFGVLKPLM